jgi:hypothetical protein
VDSAPGLLKALLDHRPDNRRVLAVVAYLDS